MPRFSYFDNQANFDRGWLFGHAVGPDPSRPKVEYIDDSWEYDNAPGKVMKFPKVATKYRLNTGKDVLPSHLVGRVVNQLGEAAQVWFRNRGIYQIAVQHLDFS